MSDAERAAEYQRMMLARTRNKAARERALAGSRSARLANRADWQALSDWLAERYDDGGEIDENDGTIFNVNPGLDP